MMMIRMLYVACYTTKVHRSFIYHNLNLNFDFFFGTKSLMFVVTMELSLIYKNRTNIYNTRICVKIMKIKILK